MNNIEAATENEPFTSSLARKGFTDDGDLVYETEVRAKGFDGVRAFRRWAAENGKRVPDVWVCAGGVLVGRFTFVVDAMEDAIERQNDEWARRQSAIDERYGR